MSQARVCLCARVSNWKNNAQKAEEPKYSPLDDHWKNKERRAEEKREETLSNLITLLASLSSRSPKAHGTVGVKRSSKKSTTSLL